MLMEDRHCEVPLCVCTDTRARFPRTGKDNFTLRVNYKNCDAHRIIVSFLRRGGGGRGDSGALNLAAVLNKNWVITRQQATWIWTVIYAWYSVLQYKGHGLMTAVEPWSGHFEVAPPVYAAAHTTQVSALQIESRCKRLASCYKL